MQSAYISLTPLSFDTCSLRSMEARPLDGWHKHVKNKDSCFKVSLEGSIARNITELREAEKVLSKVPASVKRCGLFQTIMRCFLHDSKYSF